ncbi:unnamed protein product [Ectocarpus sp. CCAP 1310/34]|nr:unnamed protein product [Ectocarpus sp. CCAP 1310/34]
MRRAIMKESRRFVYFSPAKLRKSSVDKMHLIMFMMVGLSRSNTPFCKGVFLFRPGN